MLGMEPEGDIILMDAHRKPHKAADACVPTSRSNNTGNMTLRVI